MPKNLLFCMIKHTRRLHRPRKAIIEQHVAAGSSLTGPALPGITFCYVKPEFFSLGTARRGKRSYTVQSVARAAAILSAFSSVSEVLELRIVAERTQLNKGTRVWQGERASSCE